jgi:hypothetical protein
MAVVRQEDHNTIENRVVKDMLRRCEGMATRWLQANRRHEKHEVYRAVAAFARRCRRDLRLEFLKGVSQLTTMPQPNYVLRHNSDYRELWEWYRRVVAQESETDAVWPWQHRLWAEAMQVYLAATVQEFVLARHGDRFSDQSLWMRRRSECGRWTMPDDWPGPLVCQPVDNDGRQVVIECLDSSSVLTGQSMQSDLLVEVCGALGATSVVRFSALGSGLEAQQGYLLLWAIHAPLGGVGDAALREWCEGALGATSDREALFANNDCILRGLILVSDPPAEYRGANDYLSASRGSTDVYGVRVQGPPDEWDESFMMFLEMVVDDLAGAVLREERPDG